MTPHVLAQAPDIAPWLQVAERFGVPVTLLAVAIVAGCYACRWFAKRSDRLIDRHVDFVDAMQATVTVQTSRLDDIDSSTRKTTEHLDRIADTVDRLAAAQERTSQNVQALTDSMRKLTEGPK